MRAVQELRLNAMEAAVSKSSPLIAGMDTLAMKLEELRNKVVGKGELRTLAADEHEELMLNLFGKAKEEVSIISPWVKMNKLSILDASFNSLLGRGVVVRVGFSMAPWTLRESDPEALFALYEKSNGCSNFRVYGLADTHEKVLIVDDTDAIITSYNWLSRYGTKKERGVHFTNQLMVRNEKARCMTEFVDSRLLRSYKGVPEKVENFGNHCVLRMKGCPLPIFVSSSFGEKMQWLQEATQKKEELDIITASPTSSNLLYVAGRKAVERAENG